MPFWAVLVLAAISLQLAAGVVIIVGAIQMLRLRSYRWGMTSSILALLPCSPASILGLPMGIWSLVVLSRQNVRAAFGDRKTLGQDNASKPSAKPGRTW